MLSPAATARAGTGSGRSGYLILQPFGSAEAVTTMAIKVESPAEVVTFMFQVPATWSSVTAAGAAGAATPAAVSAGAGWSDLAQPAATSAQSGRASQRMTFSRERVRPRRLSADRTAVRTYARTAPTSMVVQPLDHSTTHEPAAVLPRARRPPRRRRDDLRGRRERAVVA